MPRRRGRNDLAAPKTPAVCRKASPQRQRTRRFAEVLFNEKLSSAKSQRPLRLCGEAFPRDPPAAATAPGSNNRSFLEAGGGRGARDPPPMQKSGSVGRRSFAPTHRPLRMTAGCARPAKNLEVSCTEDLRGAESLTFSLCLCASVVIPRCNIPTPAVHSRAAKSAPVTRRREGNEKRDRFRSPFHVIDDENQRLPAST